MKRPMMMGPVLGWLGCALGLGACSGEGMEEPSFERRGELLLSEEECVVTCPVDHPNVERIGDTCVLGDGLGDGANEVVMTESLELCAGTYVLADRLLVGDGEAATELALHPGVTLLGEADTFLAIQRGARLHAEGSATRPIVLTSARPMGERAPSDWGGLVLNGRATLNTASGEGEGEGGTGTYGGSDDDDSSGILRYVRVEYAGFAIDAENELNGIAFQGVGRGTIVDHITVHRSGDDGIEFFGGTVQVKNVVLTGNEDDSIDWTEGFRGTIDTATVVQALAGLEPVAGHGIEADGSSGDPAAEPLAQPILRNVTLLGAGIPGSLGALFRRGTRVTLIDSVISGFPVCLAVDGEESTAAALAGEVVLENVTLDCEVAAADDDAGAQALLAAGGVVVTGAR